MPTLVHYEVYVHEQRGWVLQARYPGDEREVAIQDAKALELDTRKPVRVLKETYSTENSQGTESVVYKGRFQPKPGAPMHRIGGGSGGAMGGGLEPAGMSDAAPFSQSDIEAHYGEDALRSRGRATADFMFRMVLVLVTSLGLAVAGTALISVLLSRSGALLPGSAQSMLMFLVFMVLFLTTAVPMAMKYLPQDFFAARPQVDAYGRPRKPSFWVQLATVLFPPPRTDDPVVDETPVPPATAQPPAPPVEETPAAEPTPAQEAEQADAQPEAEAAQPAQEQAADESAEAEDAPDAKTDNPGFEQARLAAMKFLGGAVNAIKTTHPQLDAYNKFGVNLYLAGACDALAKSQGLSDERQADLVRESVEVIGTRPDQARQLVDRLAGYRNEARYHQMIAAGFTAMEVYLSGHSDPFIAIGGVMKDWNTPQSRQVASNAVTLMFTDMVGSTDMTQAIGDMAAQDVIRAHNHIVRTALSHFGGREVKHTGDGIMASFDEPEDAVRAAVEIQQRAEQHTARWPKLPLQLRVGMNTGEPIVEENDYFGATVQIAARVCATAGSGQVWVSEATRSLIPPSSTLKFRNRGPHTLKGVTEKVTLHEVLWHDDTKAAPAKPLAVGRSTAPAASDTPKGDKGKPNAEKPNTGTAASPKAAPSAAKAAPSAPKHPAPPPPGEAKTKTS